eukprot:4741094-Amphidinium_carterae.1
MHRGGMVFETWKTSVLIALKDFVTMVLALVASTIEFPRSCRHDWKATERVVFCESPKKKKKKKKNKKKKKKQIKKEDDACCSATQRAGTHWNATNDTLMRFLRWEHHRLGLATALSADALRSGVGLAISPWSRGIAACLSALRP